MILTLTAMGMALPISSAAEAKVADLKPVLTVSFSGYNELLADIETIGKLGDRPEMADAIKGIIAMATQGRGLVGLDKKQPIGTVVLSDGSEKFTSYCFLPISDLKQLMGLIKNPMTGEGLKEEDGVYEIPLGSSGHAYLAQRGKWSYLVEEKETLDAMPADPLPLLGDLPKQYLLAVKATLKNLPEAIREKYLAPLMSAMQTGMKRQDNESDEQYAARITMLKQNQAQVERLAKELDEFVLGMNIDRQTNKAYLDLNMYAKAGTELARDFANRKPGKTDFAGLKLPDAAITLNGTGTIEDANVAQIKNSLNAVRISAQDQLKNKGLPNEHLDLSIELLNDVFDIIDKTIDLKRTDCGMALVLKPDAVTFVAGGLMAEGAKLESALAKIVTAISKDNPKVEQYVKLNLETYKGIRFHSGSFPVPEEKMRPLVGDTIDIVLGVGNDKLFIAAGRDANKTLKQVIDQSQSEAGKVIPPMEVVVTASRIAKFLSEVSEVDQVKSIAENVSDSLEKTEGKDHILLVSQPIADGTQIRLEFEEGILKTLGGMQPNIPMGQ
jgi:hypothetical protein